MAVAMGLLCQDTQLRSIEIVARAAVISTSKIAQAPLDQQGLRLDCSRPDCSRVLNRRGLLMSRLGCLGQQKALS